MASAGSLPPESRVYADGTPAGTHDFPFDRVDAAEWRRLLAERPTRHKLHHDPPAADTHKREAGRPWRRAGEAEIAAANAAAEPEIHRKRMRGLAVQTCNGLRSRYGLEVDASGVQSKLMDASRIRARVRAIEAQGSEAVSAAAAVHDSALADGTDAEAAVSRAMEALETARARRSALEAEAAAAPPPAKGKKPKKGAPAGPTEEEVAAARGEEEAARAALEAAEEEARPSREAVAAAEARVAAARAEADAAGAAAVSPEDEASIALLDAALGFRLPAALAALGLRDPRQHDTTLV